jgi:O-antigen ligase
VALDTLLEPPPAPAAVTSRRAPVRAWVSDAAVLAALAWWATGLTRGTGGRDAHVLSIALVLLLPGLLAVQPWRRLPAVATACGLAVPVASFLVTVVAPTGWRGANEAASWTYTSLLALLVAAWCVPGWRRSVLISALALGPVFSFLGGWRAWWGGEDPGHPFLGTFYWYNQEAAFLVLGALACLSLALVTTRVARVAAWGGVALCGAGVVVATSRASLAVLIGGIGVLALLAALRRAWRVSLTSLAALPLTACASWVLTGPPFFSHRVSPLAGAQERAGSGQSLAVNGGHRLDDWAYAVKVFLHWPVTGTGFHGFLHGSVTASGDGRGALTPFAHNGFLQVLADGGLLLALPVFAALVLAAVRTGSLLRGALAERDWAWLGCLAGGLALAAHSAVDFDWSYPALLSGFGLVLAALVARTPLAGPLPARRRTRLPLLVTPLVALAAWAAWSGSLVLNAPLGGHL